MEGGETQFPHLHQAFFIQKFTNWDPPFLPIFFVLTSDVPLIEYTATTCCSPRLGSCFTFLWKSMPAPHPKCHEKLRTLFSAVLTSSVPAPPGSAMPSACQDCRVMHWERRMVGDLITVYQDWTFALQLWVEDTHCQNMEAMLCFLPANSEELPLHRATALLFSILNCFAEGKFLFLTALCCLQESICWGTSHHMSNVSKTSLQPLLFVLSYAKTYSCDFPKT